jgi:hypothetical protein
MTDWGASSGSARVRTGSAVTSLEGCNAIRYIHSEDVFLSYLDVAFLAHWAGNVVHDWRLGLAGLVVALELGLTGGVFLRIVFDLCRVSPG